MYVDGVEVVVSEDAIDGVGALFWVDTRVVKEATLGAGGETGAGDELEAGAMGCSLACVGL